MLKTESKAEPNKGPKTSARLNIKEYTVRFFSTSALSETRWTKDNRNGIIMAVAKPDKITKIKNSGKDVEIKYPKIAKLNKINPAIINLEINCGFTLMLKRYLTKRVLTA
jgi:hypothetical protein